MVLELEVAWDQLVCKDRSGMGLVCLLEWKWHGTSWSARIEVAWDQSVCYHQ